MENQSLLDQLNSAAQSGDWVMLAVLGVAVIVPIVLKALGKSVPVLDQALELAVKVAGAFRKPKPPPPAEPGKDGIAGIVPVEEKKP